MKKKLLIVHDIVHEYRVPVFERLAKIYDLTLVYAESNCNFANICTKKIRKKHIFGGKLTILIGLSKLLKDFDAVIFPLDLHYPQFFVYSFIIRKKLIWFGHGFGKSWLAHFLRLPFLHLSNAILVYYSNAKRRLIKNGICDSKIFVTNNTLYIANPVNSGSLRNNFIYIGRLQKRKKILDLCNAVEQIKELFFKYGIILKIVGDGEKNELINYINDHKLNQVIKLYPGTFDEKIIKEQFENVLAYVSPGPVGLGVLHSFAYGVPVITSRTERHGPEFENLQEYNNCILYNGSVNELAECLKFFIMNRSISNYLGKNAYDKYTSERTIDQMVAAIENGIDYATRN